MTDKDNKLMDEQRLVDLELERRVIAGIFSDPDVILPLRRTVLPDDFSDERHKVVYEVMLQLLGEFARPTVDNVLLRLEDLGWERRAGGESYAIELSSTVVGLGTGSTIDVPVWGERLATLADRRHLRRLASDIDVKAQDMGVDHEELRRQVVSLVVQGKRRLSAGEYKPLGSFVDEARAIVMGWFSGERIDVVPTGIAKLDLAIGGGLGKWQYTIIGARPGMGKTYLVENILRNAEKMGMETAIASLEMRGVDLVIRDILREAKLDGLALRNAEFKGDDDVEWKLHNAIAEVAKRRTLVNDESSQTAADMHYAMMLRYLEKGALDLFVVDYLELMGDVTGAGGDDAGARVGVVTAHRRLKALAKSVGCATVGLSQLTKAGAANPTLRTLMFGGEAEADLVLMPYWPWKMWKRNEVYKIVPGMEEVDGHPYMEDWVCRITKGRYCQEDDVLLKIKAQVGLITDRDFDGYGQEL
jgi:replicative DNA helicase